MADRLIIWCGDSWSYGSGLGIDKKKFRFPSLSSHLVDADCVNLSRPGTSIGHLVYKMHQVKRIYSCSTYDKKLVLFGLTVPYRLCIPNEHGRLVTVSVNDFDICGYKNWAKHIFTNKHIIDDVCIKLSWLAQQCKRHQINFKFYNILCNSIDLEKSVFFNYLDQSDWLVHDKWSAYSELFDTENFDFSKMSLLEKTSFGKKTKKEYMLDDGHPNQKGHDKIGKRLAKALHQQVF